MILGFCIAGLFMVVLFIAITMAGAAEDRYRERLSRRAAEDNKKMNEKTNEWAYRAALKRNRL